MNNTVTGNNYLIIYWLCGHGLISDVD